jgi:phage baseplate assembly protein W
MAISISRYFKDISLSFSRNPITNDLISLSNEDAIRKSVINLVRTRLGERFFNSLLGTSINDSLFELHNREISIILEDEIKTVLQNFEQRIRIISVETSLIEDSNEINVQISYNIVGLPLPTQNIEFLLQPTRI